MPLVSSLQPVWEPPGGAGPGCGQCVAAAAGTPAAQLYLGRMFSVLHKGGAGPALGVHSLARKGAGCLLVGWPSAMEASQSWWLPF